jgi:ABC-2 type transport system ATP-binding protein
VTANGEPCIQVAGLDKTFGDVQALFGLSFAVPRGALCALLGHNGAGKTTTIRTLLGLVTPDGGSVRVLGLDPQRNGRAVRARCGVLLERDGLYERLSAVANLKYHGQIYGLEAPACRVRIEEMLRLFGLWERRRDRVGTWSTGMRKKLALARALLHRPELLLLDEPFSGLDPVAAVQLRELIGELATHDRLTVLMTTHDLAHVERSCSHVVVADHGRAISQGTLAEVQGQLGAHSVAISGRGLDAAVLDAMVGAGLVETYEWTGDGAQVRCSPSARARLGVELVARGVELIELHTIKSSLEDVFLALVRPS